MNTPNGDTCCCLCHVGNHSSTACTTQTTSAAYGAVYPITSSMKVGAECATEYYCSKPPSSSSRHTPNPYAHQVCAPDCESIVVIVNGMLHGRFVAEELYNIHVDNISSGAPFSQPLHILCYPLFRAQMDSVHLKLTLHRDDHFGSTPIHGGRVTEMGSLGSREFLSTVVSVNDSGSEGRLRICLFTSRCNTQRTTSGGHINAGLNINEGSTHASLDRAVPCASTRELSEEQILDHVSKLFHDDCSNPTFGSLRLTEVHASLGIRLTVDELCELLRRHTELCTVYEGRDKETWVALHSHCKRVTIPPSHVSSYASLVQHIANELKEEEKPLSDLFRRVMREEHFRGLLASNFTFLKKFLTRNNHHFSWFLDAKTRTTKVVLSTTDALAGVSSTASNASQ